MQDLIRSAMQLHQAGQLREAEIRYRKCLEQNPDHPDALHLLGMVAYQCGHHLQAEKLISRAIRVNSNVAAYHFHLAEVCRAQGRTRDVVESCRQALVIDPTYVDAHNNMGLALLALNEAPQAEDSFRRAIEIRPEFALAWNNLGTALRNQQRFSEAIDAYHEALRIAPAMPEAHNNLGRILLEKGHVDDALHHCREATRLRPEFAEAHCNLGNTHRAQGNYAAARAAYEQALRLSPQTAMIHNNMAQLLQEEGCRDEALTWYRQALKLAPRTPRFHCNLASLLVQQGDYETAIEHFHQALAIFPHDSEAHDGLGQVYRDTGGFTQAVAEFKTAIRLQPRFAEAHLHLGETLAEIGDLKQAHHCYRDAIEIDKTSIGAWVNLATHHIETLSDSDVQNIEGLVTDPYLKDGARSALNFALAQVFDSKEEYGRAARYSVEANRCQMRANELRKQGYDPHEHWEHVDQLIECFDEQYFARVCGSTRDAWGSRSETPVFIVGIPRSGTTLTEQILASHPNIHGAGERRLARQSLEAVMSMVPANRQIKQRLAGLTQAAVTQSASAYLQQLTNLNPGAARIVDKMPDNYLYLGWIVTLFPRARIIHCRRNPCSIAVSCWLTSFKGIRWANDPKHIAHRIKNYQRLMRHWARVLPIEILEVDYDQTVTELPAVAHRMIDYIGLPWDERCLEFYRTQRPVSTASVTQVRQPVYQKSIARRKQYEPYLPDLFAPLLEENP